MGFFDFFFGKRAVAVPTAKPETDEPRALLIGNIGYPSAPLNGCWNDTLNVDKVLRDASLCGNLYQDESRVRIIQDCPTDQMIDAMKWLAKTSGAKTLLTSGHGTQIPSTEESDGFTEVFCPVDFDWTPEHMVTDDQFAQIFKDCVGPFNWLSDSCHSGDLIKSIPKHKILRKTFPLANRPSWIQAALRTRRRKVSKLKAMIAKGQMNVGFVSGCRSDQTSADAFIDGNYCGAMTWYFLQALRENRAAKLKDLVSRTNELLRQNDYDQQPDAEGAYVNKPFLG